MKSPLLVQVFQWVYETDFVYLFCKTQENKRVIFKVHSLQLKSYVLVDDVTSLTEDMVEEFQAFLITNSFPCKLTFKKRFGTFFDASGDKHRLWKFVEISHPPNKHLYFLKNILKSFERRCGVNFKTFHTKIDPVVRLFQHHRNLTPCMFVELNTDDPLVKYIPSQTIRASKCISRTFNNHQSDAMFSFPIKKLQRCLNPPPFNFPLRIVAFDFECTGTSFETDVIYQASFVFETVFIPEGGNVLKDTKRFLLNVGDCAPIEMEDGSAVTVKSYPDEKEFLKGVMMLLVHNQWDIITGYNIYGKFLKLG